MIKIPTDTHIVRLATCLLLIGVAVQPATAQDPQQLPLQPSPTVQAISVSGAIAPGYYQTNPEAWPRSGWISSQGRRPLPPGYAPNENGEIVFKNQLFPGVQPGWWRPSCMVQNMGVLCHERTSFHMYIRGYGPAIHTRPASIWW